MVNCCHNQFFYIHEGTLPHYGRACVPTQPVEHTTSLWCVFLFPAGRSCIYSILGGIFICLFSLPQIKRDTSINTSPCHHLVGEMWKEGARFKIGPALPFTKTKGILSPPWVLAVTSFFPFHCLASLYTSFLTMRSAVGWHCHSVL